MTRIIFTLFILGSVLAAQAQEVLKPLGASSILAEAWKKRQAQAQTQKTQSVQAKYLPFYDDFSSTQPYPDPTKWENSTSVFVNHTKAINPITLGVATFDGLMANGYPYHPAATSGSQPSDTLTSIPLRLDSSLNGVQIIPTDSVYLRFYWQAKGIWEAPESTDELKLEFNSPLDGDSVWTQVWSRSGYAPSASDTNFHREMIIINDPHYLQNGFRFRFRNLSTGCGDVDHWHIDGIFLDKNLNPNRDTIVQEISFVRDVESLLATYSQMPYKQFTGASDMKTNFSEYENLRNNFTTPMTVTTFYQIENNSGLVVAQYTNGTNNIPTFSSSGFCNDPALVNPSIGTFVYNNGPFADSTSFLLKFYAHQNSDVYPTNDTVYYRQTFDNYYAYDDGSAEAGYGLGQNGGSTASAVGAFTAVRYQVNVADTLRSVDIFFDPIYGVNDLENAGIQVRVWKDAGGLPGEMYNDSAMWQRPVFSHNGFDVFQRYQLASPITFSASTVFYVGVWQQLAYPLYVGYDLNTDHHTQVFYRTPNNTFGSTGWNVAGFKGSLMIRPVFGDSLRAVGVKNFVETKEKTVVYPNPATNEIFASSASGVTRMTICDMLGNVLLDEKVSRLNTSSLSNGVYLVKTITASGHTDVQKLFIVR
jgi:hypothetical protein